MGRDRIVVSGPDADALDRRSEPVSMGPEVRRARQERATWPRIPRLSLLSPWFHLDHVQASGFDVLDADTLVIPGSEHLAVWAALAPAS